MNDPYVVLGVSRDSTDQQIKDAYRELAKKYHPDNYADNPLSDLANEKMQEINQAYDTIMNERRSGGSSGSSGSNGSSAGNSNFAAIRSLIQQNMLDEALRQLDAVEPSNRNAEWYFLSGSVQYKRGWFDNAYTNFATACRMDPQNFEYRQAMNAIQSRRGGFNPYNSTGRMGTSGCSGCDVCQGLICIDCCCECMGGDLIRCC